MKKIIATILALTLVLALFAGFASAEEIQYKGEIKIGGLAPMTGPYAEFGKGFKYSWEKAIDEINAAGGANGWKLVIDVRDTQGDAVQCTTLATEFCEDEEYKLILGEFASTNCLAITDIIDRYGIVQLSPTCSSPMFATGSIYNFSINGLTSIEGMFAAKYIVGEYLGGKNCVVLRANNDWSEATVKPFAEQCEREGIEILLDEKYQVDETDFSSIVTKVRALDPDVVVIMDQGTAISAICNACNAVGYDVPTMNIGAPGSQQVADQLVKKNLYCLATFVFDPEYKELEAWRQQFVADNGYEPTTHSVQAHDTVWLLKAAIEKIGDGEITRESLREALYCLEIDGFGGKIIFNPEGDITRRALYIMQVSEDDGLWHVQLKREFDPAEFYA
ncbi:MAG: ABC transporter substrate-binding protein [Clostridia bacterium]|nr:ABC transporter substrate-binding protein [Clostridia bacterium]